MSNSSINGLNLNDSIALSESKRSNIYKLDSPNSFCVTSLSHNKQLQIQYEISTSKVNLAVKPRNSLELYSEVRLEKKENGTVDGRRRLSTVSTVKPLIDLSNGNQTIHNNLKLKRRQTISVCFVSLIFFFCVIPIKLFQILKFIIDIDNLEITHTVFLISKLLFYTHIMSNPIVYNLMSTKFSRSFKNVLFCKKFKCKIKKSKSSFQLCF